MEREFVFNCTAPDGQSARAQIAAALEKRMDLYSRERLPWLWGLADRLNRVEKVSQQVSDRRARVRRVLGTVDWVLGTMLLAAAWTEPAELPLLLVVGIVGTVLGILCLWKRRRAVLAVLHLALGVVFLMASFGDPAELSNLMSLGFLYLVIGIAAIVYKKRKAGNPYEQQAGPLAELLAEVAGLLGEKTAALEEIAGRSRSLARSMSNLMDDTADAAEYSQDIVDNLDYLIEDLTALNDSLDTYYPDLQEALDDSARLVERTAEALSSGVSLMTIVQNTLKTSSEDMDQAARDSLAAGMQVLDKSLGILDSTEAMRRAGRVMKDTMDSQLDKFDTENRFLFMDPEAPKRSFTSDKNPEPETIQVVLRTDEISLEDEAHQLMDMETEKEAVSPWQRMWNVLMKIWQAIVEIFKER